MMPYEMKKSWLELDFSQVMAYFLKGFDLAPNEEIVEYEYYYDAAKDKIAIKLVTIRHPKDTEDPTN